MKGGLHCAVWPGHSNHQQTQYFEKAEYEALLAARERGVQLTAAETEFITAWEGRA